MNLKKALDFFSSLKSTGNKEENVILSDERLKEYANISQNVNKVLEIKKLYENMVDASCSVFDKVKKENFYMDDQLDYFVKAFTYILTFTRDNLKNTFSIYTPLRIGINDEETTEQIDMIFIGMKEISQLFQKLKSDFISLALRQAKEQGKIELFMKIYGDNNNTNS